ncbi:MAG: methyltransferase domain-containing protein [Coriobacteriia bacterium]|nr:methyltransferase domain-containing protein [Coriobacteriia bacterium]
MDFQKFDTKKIKKLDDKARFETLVPELMWEALGSPDPQDIVDIGAGTGLFSARFAEMAPNAQVYAVDIEAVMLEYIAENTPSSLKSRITTVQSAEVIIPLDTETMDIAVMINLHHELADPLGTYTEVLRIVRPGGKLLIVDWAQNDLPGGPPQDIRATPESIIELLMHIGFDSATVHAGLPKHSMVTAEKR